MPKNRSWGLGFLDVGDWLFKMPIPPEPIPTKTDPEIVFFDLGCSGEAHLVLFGEDAEKHRRIHG